MASKKTAARRPATRKPAKKSAPAKPAKKLVKKVAKPTPKAKKPSKPASRKVVSRPVKGKMLRHAVATKKAASAPAVKARPVAAAALRKPVALAKSTVRPGSKPPPKAARRAAPAERKSLPHKAPQQGFSFNDYFDGNASPYPTLPPSRREVLPVAVEWKERMRPGELYQIFKRFFEANEIGNRLIGTLREGAAAIIEFDGDPQIYKVVKVRGRALFESGRPASAEVYLKFSRHAVEALLAPNATKPLEYVQRMSQLMSEPDPLKRLEIKLLSTHGEAVRKGYLGVVAAGGKLLASSLAALHFALPHEFVKQLR